MNTTRFTLSVDDGHPLDLKMAELLDRHDVAATFYVPMANCEGLPVMTAPQLRSIAARFELGSHTAEHRFLTGLGRAAAWRQIRDGKAELENILGQRVQGFCYPGGQYRREHVALVRAAGFTYARTIQNLRMEAGTRAYELPTSLQFYPHPRRVLIRNFVSQADWLLRLPALLAVCSASDWVARLYALFDYAHQRGAMFHLWLHTAAIETLQLWPALDAFLGYVARRVPRTQRLTNGAWFRQEFQLQGQHARPTASCIHQDAAHDDGLCDARANRQPAHDAAAPTVVAPLSGACGESPDAPDCPASRRPAGWLSPFHTIR